MEPEIYEVRTRRELRQFVAFPYALYRDNPYWVPPPRGEELNSLRTETNPAFEFCESRYWLARIGGRIVGRIAGIINHRFNQKWHARAARFGWFDFIDDPDIAKTLLITVENWASERGMTSCHGPLGFTDLDGEGTLIEGFEEVSTLGAIYNFPYYANHIEQAGYSKDADWLEFQVTMHPEIPEKVSRLAEIALQRNRLHLLHVSKRSEMLPYAREIFALLNLAYKDLYGFVELSEKQIEMYVKQYFGFILPEYVPVVLDESNKVVAFGIAMPSLSRAFQRNRGRLFPFGFLHVLRAIKTERNADLYLTAVRPDAQNKGINAILIHEMHKAFVRRGVDKVETNRELEANAKVQAQWRYYDHRQHKRRRCYKRDIQAVGY